MQNYYDALNIPPTSSVAEIETALDSKYNYWRRLVTHHDPDTVQRANQALLYVEKIRTTLLDPDKRVEYDQALVGPVVDQVGGLADPMTQAAVQAPILTPPGSAAAYAPGQARGVSTAADQVVVERVDAWICPKCSKANQIGHMYCKECGTALAQTCGNCRTQYEKRASFCPSCGLTPAAVEERNGLLVRINRLEQETGALARTTAGDETRSWLLDTIAIGMLGWAGFMVGVGLLYSLSSGPLILLRMLALNYADIYAKISWLTELASRVHGIGRFLMWVGTLALFVFFMYTRHKLNPAALGGYFVLSLIGISLTGVNYRYISYANNASLIFPVIIAGGLLLLAAGLLASAEPKAWLALLLGGALAIVIFATSLSISVVIVIATLCFFALTALTGLVGFRVWTIADLEAQRKVTSKQDVIARREQIGKELAALNQKMAQLTSRQGGQ